MPPEVPSRCNFIGHLANEPGACVGFTGCPELEDVELTIMSSRIFGSPLFKWKRDGIVERIIHPYMVIIRCQNPKFES